MYLLTLFAIVILLMVLIRRIGKWNEMRRKVNKFPGPKMTPFIGDLEYMMGKKDEIIPMVHNRALIYRKLYAGWFFFIPVVVLYNASYVEKVISNVNHNEKGMTYIPLQPWLGTGLLTSKGQKWHNRRKLLTPSFHFSILHEFLEIFNSESRRLVRSLMQNCNTEIDIKPLISQFTLNSICETVLGISLPSNEHGSQYRKSIEDFIDIVIRRVQSFWLQPDTTFKFSKYYRHQENFVEKLHAFSTSIITERKKYVRGMLKDNSMLYSKKRKAGMLDLMLMNQIKYGDIDDEGIREEVDTFTFEGHDTTAVSLTYTLMLLANNRECQDKIYEEIMGIFGDSDREITNSDLQEMKYLEMCIKESLRLYPSVPYIGRIVGSDIELDDGLIIPKGCNILVSIIEMHRDPEVFPDPEKFDPDRFLPEICRDPFAYIPFSGGPRNCIGQKFAMMELKCCIVEILRNFVLEPIDKPEALTFPLDVVLRNNGPIRIKFLERNCRKK